MTTPRYVPESGEPTSLGILAQAFTGQEGVGITGGLIERAARWLLGDPVYNITATSTGVANVGIMPDQPGVKSALLYVGLNSIFARWDGSVPVSGADFYIPQGSYIVLTGVPTIKGFQFVSAVAANATLYGCYFT